MKHRGNDTVNQSALAKFFAKSGLSRRNRKKYIFYFVMMAWPIIQFCVFYIGINVNSIIMSFQSFNTETNEYYFSGFTNVVAVYNNLIHDSMFHTAIENSFIFFGVTLFCTCLALFFSYYVYKKMPGSKFFRLVLYLPSVISPVVLAIMFRYCVDRALPDIMSDLFGKQMSGLLVSRDTLIPTVAFYNVLLAFGVNVLMYTSTMSGISESVIESAQLDGATQIREFFSIVLPLIYPTLATFLTVSTANLFIDQAQLFALFSDQADRTVYTMGYYLYMNAYRNVTYAQDASYPELATYGVILTIVAMPITLIVRYCLNRFGPSAD